jgi:GT2 family glycosyltransferase/2-polyprenyl-3-methyl-5-hydroxy-6-metoxy-1,4-benzoquinol methylase/glycosyltransferase involved in cell wall biosynthesis
MIQSAKPAAGADETTPLINTPAWWEHYFSGDWLRYGGPDQTRHFMERLVAALPLVDRELLESHARTIADWGCAFGEGSVALADAFVDAEVHGYDGSAVAIEEARQRHGHLAFSQVPSGGAIGSLPRRYDVVVNSNCLEHFIDWMDVLRANLASTELLHLSLVPYREQPLSEHHVVTLDEQAFPEKLGDFTRVIAKVIDVDNRFWPSGKQLLVGYASDRYLALRTGVRGNDADEREKWEAYYRDLPLEKIDDFTAAFNDEFVQLVGELLPKGSEVLEAGCGGGSQSLAMARAGYRAALLDFSPAALDYAKRLFASEGVAAEFVEADAFAKGAPAHDLVFNAGVLEHYTLEEQAAFLRGMASRSRRYVLVLIPNRACYWYWLWRVRRTAASNWPFGKEVPQTELADAFAAAGLHYIGQTYVGANWTESFIRDCGLDPAAQEQLLEIHRSAVIPAVTKGYLLAALGSVEPADEVPARWRAPSDAFDERATANWTALLADALAGRIAAEQSYRTVEGRYEAEARELQLKARQAELDLQVRLDELNVVSGKLMESQRELAHMGEWARQSQQSFQQSLEVQQQRFQQALELQQQSFQQALELQQQRFQQALEFQQQRFQKPELFEQSFQHSLQQVRDAGQLHTERLQASMGAVRAQLDVLTRSTFHYRSRRAGSIGRTAIRLALTDPYQFARRVSQRLPLSPGARHRIGGVVRKIVGKRAANQKAVYATADFPRPPSSLYIAPRSELPDVFVFAIIDWHFRTQRPQQIARALAAAGHRVFYLSNHFVDSAQSGFAIEALDSEGRLFQVRLHVPGAPAIYFGTAADREAESLRESLRSLLVTVSPTRTIGLVQHPYWWPLTALLPNTTSVYDCMDHHAGFGGVPQSLLDTEVKALSGADVLVTTSAWLEERFRPGRPDLHLVRNACDFDFFAKAPERTWRDPKGRGVVGYIGAIAEWFDGDLLDRLAIELPEVCFRLVGNDTAGVAAKLAHRPNVEFVGERPYAELPYHLSGFDVCLLPFRVMPLTLATNPVKVYEYLAAGKKVVAIDLPEIAQFAGLVRPAGDHAAFVQQVRDALQTQDDESTILARQTFAARQTWGARAEQIRAAIADAREPKVSVIVLTYNNLALTQACLASVVEESDYRHLEIVVVDNASTDGSPVWLQQWAQGRDNVRLILNDTNTGFAAGNNIGLRASTGDYFVLLNNDTVVTRGWVRTMLCHFKRSERLGLLGPVTNNIGNEARIDVEYATMEEMTERARLHTLTHAGRRILLRTAAFFCVMLRRAVYENVGELCEEYSRGFFEDDDYCRRVERAGWSIECAEDVFVHHHLSASFNALGAVAKTELFEKNRAIYEAKWGDWRPHSYRTGK